jgi:hypothetical protein
VKTSSRRPARASRVGVSPKAKFSSAGTSSRHAKSSQMLVDAHPEGDRGDDDVAVRARPPLLHRDPLLRAHPGVIRTGGKADRREARGDAQRRALQRHVHDRRAGRPRAQPVDQQLIPRLLPDGRGQEGQVGPVEARDHGVCLGDSESLADVGDDGRRGGRGQSEHAFGSQLAGAYGELQVVGAEVMAPFRDAVRLVDREERDLRPLELGEEALVVEALRGDVEELQAARPEPVGDVAHLLSAEAGIEAGGVDAVAGEEVDLVLHQGDQRRDHDGDAVEQQRGKLVAEALAAAGGEDRERRAAGQER